MPAKTSAKTNTKAIFSAVVATLALLAAFYWIWSSRVERRENPHAAPAFTLEDASGKKHSLRDYRDYIVLVHFWAKWCAPCLEEIPVLVEFAKSFEDRPLRVLAISLDPTWEDAHQILPPESLPKNMILLLDATSKVAELYGSYKYPETYLLDQSQTILKKWVGPQEWKSDFYHKSIERLFRSSP